MEIIEDIMVYYKTKIPPANIKTIVKYLHDYGNTNQIIFKYCTDIIRDWSYKNDTRVLLETDYLKFIENVVVSTEFFIFNLTPVLMTLYNIFQDTRHQSLINFGKLIPRIKYCNNTVYCEWLLLLKNYSAYYFDIHILKYACTLLKQRQSLSECLHIILNQCKLDDMNATKILDTNDIFNEIIFQYNTSYYKECIKIIEFGIKNKIQLKFNLMFIENLHVEKYFYTFLSLLLKHQYSFYRNCDYIDFYTTSIFTSKTNYTLRDSQIMFLNTLLQTNHDLSRYGKSTFLYLNKILKYKLHDQIIYTSLRLVRKIYDYDSTIISKRLLKKYILHPQSDKYFCTSLQEKTYRTCLLNNIKVDNCFKCFN